tara:strand:- start:1732 stop:2439 length:708 start_codon:yes stop_codon:yes gene_type:complete
MNELNRNYNLTQNFWKKKYHSPNVESIVFRLQSKILKHEYNLPKKRNSKLIDFGCGEGSSSNFFARQGYKTFGLDISKISIKTAKQRFKSNKNLKFEVCKMIPSEQRIYGFDKGVDVIFALQSLYYLGKKDFFDLLEIFNKSLKKNGLIFATFKTPNQWEYYKNSKKTKDPWLRHVKFKNSRINVNLTQFFVKNEKDMIKRMSIFKPLHIGKYTMKLTNYESEGEHLTFFGKKRS